MAVPSSVGSIRRQENCRRQMAAALKRAGLPNRWSPHSLRHTFASVMTINGANLKVLQQHLGHSSITLTADTYGDGLTAQADTGILDRVVSAPLPMAAGAESMSRVLYSRWDGKVAELVAGYQDLRRKLWCARQESNLRPSDSKTVSGGFRWFSLALTHALSRAITPCHCTAFRSLAGVSLRERE